MQENINFCYRENKLNPTSRGTVSCTTDMATIKTTRTVYGLIAERSINQHFSVKQSTVELGNIVTDRPVLVPPPKEVVPLDLLAL